MTRRKIGRKRRSKAATLAVTLLASTLAPVPGAFAEDELTPAHIHPSASSSQAGSDSYLRLGRPGRGSGLSSTRFPEDLFAQPAYTVWWDDLNPIRNSIALRILAEGEASQQDDKRKPYLLRTTPEHAHLCRIPVPEGDAQEKEPHSSTAYLQRLLNSTSAGYKGSLPALSAQERAHAVQLLDAERKRIIARGLQLLEPMKDHCVYLQVDWFTYSFCHGKHIRQFRALPPQAAAIVAAAQKHIEGGGGGAGTSDGLHNHLPIAQRRLPNGEIAYEVNLAGFKGRPSDLKSLQAPSEPMVDTQYDAFVLGRWNKAIETVAGTGRHFQEISAEPSTPAGKEEAGEGSHSNEPHSTNSKDLSESEGTELMEVVRFGQGEEQRYLVQTWSDGTRCDINNEPRMVEVQYHCNRNVKERIAVIKEVTTCNYVMVIETARLCDEPAFLVGQEDQVHEVQCRPIVSDEWNPLTQHQRSSTPSPADTAEPRSQRVAIESGEAQSKATAPKKTFAEQEFERAQREAPAAPASTQDGESQSGTAPEEVNIAGYDEDVNVVFDPVGVSGDMLKALDLDIDDLLAEAAVIERETGKVVTIDLDVDPADFDRIRASLARGENAEQAEAQDLPQESLLDRLAKSVEKDLRSVLDQKKKTQKKNDDSDEADEDDMLSLKEGETETPEQAALRERMKAMSTLLMQALGSDASEKRSGAKAEEDAKSKHKSTEGQAQKKDAKSGQSVPLEKSEEDFLTSLGKVKSKEDLAKVIRQANEGAKAQRRKASAEFMKRVENHYSSSQEEASSKDKRRDARKVRDEL